MVATIRTAMLTTHRQCMARHSLNISRDSWQQMYYSIHRQSPENRKDPENAVKGHALVTRLSAQFQQTAPLLMKRAAHIKNATWYNILVVCELLRIIAREQHIIPDWSSWPQAQAVYLAAFSRLRRTVRDGQLVDSISHAVSELTWSDVGRGGRRLAEIAAFYYLGVVSGMTAALTILAIRS